MSSLLSAQSFVFSPDTTVIHAEAIRTLLALLSSQLYQERVTEDSVFLAYLMRLCVLSSAFCSLVRLQGREVEEVDLPPDGELFQSRRRNPDVLQREAGRLVRDFFRLFVPPPLIVPLTIGLQLRCGRPCPER